MKREAWSLIHVCFSVVSCHIATMKTHSLFYEDACALHAKYPKLNLYPLQWSAPASILSEWLLPLEKAFVREEIIWTFELDRTLTLASPSGTAKNMIHG